MIRQRNQDAAGDFNAIPFLALMFGVSVVCQLGVSLTSKLTGLIDRNFGNK